MPLLDRLREGVHRTEMGGFDLTFYPPVSTSQLDDAEAALGFPLPQLLRDIYLAIGNGGFGPGYGLLGLFGGHSFVHGDRRSNVADLYRLFRRSDRLPRWDDKLLPICHWGCGYFSYVDCALPDAPVFAFDEGAHGHGPWGSAFGLHDPSFEGWMQRWVDGERLWDSFNAIGEPIFGFEQTQQA